MVGAGQVRPQPAQKGAVSATGRQCAPCTPDMNTAACCLDWGGHERCQQRPACRFASIAKLAGEQLQPYVAALIPRLYRGQHDPNAGVREAMTRIWQALVPDER